jgi:hypothetical protein
MHVLDHHFLFQRKRDTLIFSTHPLLPPPVDATPAPTCWPLELGFEVSSFIFLNFTTKNKFPAKSNARTYALPLTS